MKSIFPKISLLASESLLAQILGLSFIFTAVLTIVIGAFAYFLSASVIKTETRDKLTAIALVKEDNLNRWVEEQKRNLVFLASLPSLRNEAGALASGTLQPEAQTAQALNDYFRSVITTTADSQEILLLDVTGKVLLASTPEHVGTDQSQEVYFQSGLSSTSVTSFYISPLLHAPTITISTPLFDQNGKRVGVLASHLSLAAVDHLIRERNGLSASGEIYLVNENHQLITVDPLAEQTKVWLHSPGIDAALNKNNGSGLYENGQGVPVIGAYLWIEERDIAIIVEVNQAEALSPTKMLSGSILIMGLVVMAVSILVIYLIARRLLQPIKILTETATKIAAGQLDLKVPVTSHNEVGRLAQAFNVMTSELKQSLHGLEELNDELEARVAARTTELVASNQEMEAFSYSVSHDLRAPLRAISGFSRILLLEYTNQLPAEAHDLLKKIFESATYMGKLVDGLLSFSRLGRQAMRPQAISGETLRAMVSRIIAEIQMDNASSHVAVRIGTLEPCYADSLLLHQVFVNLISNAFKFSQKQPEALVEIDCTLTEAGTAYFVRDNGVGFEMKYVEKLFGVFQRLHHHSEFEGTGVGLAIVQRIIQRHQGAIWAESEPDRGATFTFTLGLKENKTGKFD